MISVCIFCTTERRNLVYARNSSDNQREESIEGQIRECTAYAEKKDSAERMTGRSGHPGDYETGL